MSLRPLYLTLGAVGGTFTLSLILLPQTPMSFGVAVIGQNVFQSLGITCCIAIAFEVIGRDNPLAATTYALLACAYAFPISYMPFADGWGYSLRRVAGMFGTDGGIAIAACLLMCLILWLASPRLEKKEPTLAQLTDTAT